MTFKVFDFERGDPAQLDDTAGFDLVLAFELEFSTPRKAFPLRCRA